MLINASRMAESVNACSLKQLQQKLAALTAVNSALTVENEDLRAQLEALDEEGTTADVTELQEEFEKRLGAADRSVAELRVGRQPTHQFPSVG
jgi:regulator of replication initiation timing